MCVGGGGGGGGGGSDSIPAPDPLNPPSMQKPRSHNMTSWLLHGRWIHYHYHQCTSVQLHYAGYILYSLHSATGCAHLRPQFVKYLEIVLIL